MKLSAWCEHGVLLNNGPPFCGVFCACGHTCDMHGGGCRCGCPGFRKRRAPGPKLSTRNARKRERKARRS
jgi:hypothetical protein